MTNSYQPAVVKIVFLLMYENPVTAKVPSQSQFGNRFIILKIGDIAIQKTTL